MHFTCEFDCPVPAWQLFARGALLGLLPALALAWRLLRRTSSRADVLACAAQAQHTGAHRRILPWLLSSLALAAVAWAPWSVLPEGFLSGLFRTTSDMVWVGHKENVDLFLVGAAALGLLASLGVLVWLRFGASPRARVRACVEDLSSSLSALAGVAGLCLSAFTSVALFAYAASSYDPYGHFGGHAPAALLGVVALAGLAAWATVRWLRRPAERRRREDVLRAP